MDSKLLLGACQRTEHRPHVCVHAYVPADALPAHCSPSPCAYHDRKQSNNCMAGLTVSQSQGRAWHACLLPLGS